MDGENEARGLKLDRASALLQRHRIRLSTGCVGIDACLGGGILARGITEIAGEASAGKTQVRAGGRLLDAARARAGGYSAIDRACDHLVIVRKLGCSTPRARTGR
jgi:RecA/RadA recombinase